MDEESCLMVHIRFFLKFIPRNRATKIAMMPTMITIFSFILSVEESLVGFKTMSDIDNTIKAEPKEEETYEDVDFVVVEEPYNNVIGMEVTISTEDEDCSCDLCEVTFLDINENYEDIVNFFIQHNVLKNEIQCGECLHKIELNKRDLVFRCSNKNVNNTKRKCYFIKSARKHTILEHSTIRIKPFFNFVAVLLFLKPPRVKIYKEHLKLSNSTFSIWSKLCRDVLIKWSYYNWKKIGGVDKTVEIDINNVCGGSTQILGGVCRETRDIFLVPLEKKPGEGNNISSKIIGNLIQENVEQKSSIITKEFCVYDCIKEDPTYTHYSVRKLVDESTGAHVNHIQRLWRDLKMNLPQHSFKSNETVLPYIAEYKFKRTHADIERMHYFFKAAAYFY